MTSYYHCVFGKKELQNVLINFPKPLSLSHNILLHLSISYKILSNILLAKLTLLCGGGSSV